MSFKATNSKFSRLLTELHSCSKAPSLVVLLTLGFKVDVLGVLLFGELWHAEVLSILFQVGEHVGVLVSAEPLIFPIKSEGLTCAQKLL